MTQKTCLPSRRIDLTAALAVTIAVMSVGSTEAQEAGRYRMERNGDGFVRLDTQTGAMTLCKEKEGTLSCRMGADERAAFEDETQRLEQRIAALEGKATDNGNAAGIAGTGKTDLPSDEEIDRSIGIMERFMRSFFGLVEEFEERQEDPLPDRS